MACACGSGFPLSLQCSRPEPTGHFWVQGRALGRQYLGTVPDEENADMLVAIGWNGMESHQMPRAPWSCGVFQKPEQNFSGNDPS